MSISNSGDSGGGWLSDMKSKAGGMATKPFELIDGIKNPYARKAAAIGLDLVIIGVALTILFASFGLGFPPVHFAVSNLSSMIDPSWTTAMKIVPIVLLGGAGLAMLTEHIIGKKWFRKIAPIAAIALPILFLGASVTLLGLAFTHAGGISGGAGATNFLFYGGLLLLAGVPWGAGMAISRVGGKRPKYHTEPITQEDRARWEQKNLENLRARRRVAHRRALPKK